METFIAIISYRIVLFRFVISIGSATTVEIALFKLYVPDVTLSNGREKRSNIQRKRKSHQNLIQMAKSKEKSNNSSLIKKTEHASRNSQSIMAS